LLLIAVRSFLALEKAKWVETFRNVLKISVLTLCPSAKPGSYWTVRRGRRFG
jgi:hypothetical protein